MDLRKTLLTASGALTNAGIDHALIGGFALAVHGVNRATADVDLIADGSRRPDIRSSLTGAGFSIIQATDEVLQFSGVGQLDVLLANRPLSQRMIKDAIQSARVPVRVLRAEDIIGLKIQAYCNDESRALRDQADIQALIRTSPNLDWTRVRSYADLFDQWTTIERLRANS